MVAAALSGELVGVPTRIDPVFGITVPERVSGVPDAMLDPRRTWADAEAYDQRAAELAEMFNRNFEQFAADAGDEILAAGPVASQPT